MLPSPFNNTSESPESGCSPAVCGTPCAVCPPQRFSPGLQPGLFAASGQPAQGGIDSVRSGEAQSLRTPGRDLPASAPACSRVFRSGIHPPRHPPLRVISPSAPAARRGRDHPVAPHLRSPHAGEQPLSGLSLVLGLR